MKIIFSMIVVLKKLEEDLIQKIFTKLTMVISILVIKNSYVTAHCRGIPCICRDTRVFTYHALIP